MIDCYDGQRHLILRRGVVVNSAKQIEYLLERGLYDLGASSRGSDGGYETPLVENAVSPFQRLEACYVQLENLLLGSGTDANHVGAAQASTPVSSFRSPTQLLTDFLDGKEIAASDIDADHPHPFPGQVLQLAAELQAVCLADADAVIGAIHRDTFGPRYSIGHSLSRALLCELLAARCRIPPRNRRHLMAAALTCDLAMLSLLDELSTHEDSLRPEHRQAIAEHPQHTVTLLAALGVNDPSWTNAVIQHHEFPNGAGYPAGLAETAISPWARILKLADTYSAMLSRRSYRKALQSKDVFRQFFQKRGKEFDEQLATLFMNELGVFPPGLAVKLQNGEHAVIIRRGSSPRTPLAKAVKGVRGVLLVPTVLRLTEIPEYAIVDVLEADAVGDLDMGELWGYGH